MGDLILYLLHNLWLCNNVSNAYSESSMDEPIVHDKLNVRKNVSTSLWPKVLPNDMDQAACSSTDNTFRDVAAHHFAIFDYNGVILGSKHIVTLLQIDCLWNDKTQNLLACPERLGL